LQFAIFNLQFLVVLLVASTAAAQVLLPEFDTTAPISITARAGNRWQAGAYEVWALRGDCVIRQGTGYASCREAVLWIDRTTADDRREHKIIAYLEGDVKVVPDGRPGAGRLTDSTWLGRFYSTAGVEVRPAETAGKPERLPDIYWRGIERRNPESAGSSRQAAIQPAQYNSPAPGPAPAPNTMPNAAPSAIPNAAPGATPDLLPGPAPPPAPGVAPMAPTGPPGVTAPPLVPLAVPASPAVSPVGVRRIRAFPRSNVPVQFQLWGPADLGCNRWMAVINSGVNVVVDTTVKLPGIGEVGTIDISADRIVIWTVSTSEPDLQNGQTGQDERTPLEFYMEGNIVFRQGERVIYADRMYYDVPNRVGTIINADLLTPAPSYEGLLRLHADVVRQTAQDRFTAERGFLTSSRMGSPTYRFQSNEIFLQDFQQPVIDPVSKLPVVDSCGRPVVEHERLATANNDFVYLGPVPVFYWPTIATDLNDPTYYIRRVQMREDNVFGNQFLTDWDAYQLLGIRKKPKGTSFDISLDYLSKRGFGYGADFNYGGPEFLGIPGPTKGLADFWAIQDGGLDDLGQQRTAVPPEASYRYRLLWQHRQMLPLDLQLTAEVGWISDRNFVEEYHKNEWDELKDEITGLELKHLIENRSWSITADYRINDFVTGTNWLPRGDHFWLGQPLFDVFTWYEHSNAAYAQFRRTTIPENISVGPMTGPAGPFNFLPWEAADAQGARLATRQEIDYPFQLGAVKLVPYALGELAYWGQDINGNSLDRLFWQAGLRADLPIWSVNPAVNSDLFNVHGIAHKVDFQFEFAFAQANQNLEQLPLYDPLDDDSVEAFRRRYLTTTFGIPSLSPLPLPPGTPWVAKFDERLYALRSGLQSWVTSPSTEIAGDLTTVRLGVEQRWQTKRGPADCRRIIDWMTLDTNVTLFPDPNRDNFGQVVGLLNYDYTWHVGDRLTLLSDGIYDFFSQGQRITSFGAFLNRPPRGSLYLGFRILEGPINSKPLTLSYSYWMSPKWVSSFGTTIDMATQGNLGENFTVTRVGESFLISVGFNVDNSRNDVGVSLAIEPRFLPKNRLGTVGGAQIPPAGAFGLE
jgi:hypothetical protein